MNRASRALTSGLGSLYRGVFSLKGALVGLGAGLAAKSFIEAASTSEDFRVRLETPARFRG